MILIINYESLAYSQDESLAFSQDGGCFYELLTDKVIFNIVSLYLV